ncbi:MAG: hypothetical protein ACTSV2_03885 [Candidatus Thorarchaeota archaeon]
MRHIPSHTPATLGLIFVITRILSVIDMVSPENTAARLTLKIAGVYQDVHDSWIKRVNTYYDQIESLIEGEWFELADMKGIIREAKMATREALDGLGNDLSSELVHASSGVVQRYEYERASFVEEINDLRATVSRSLSGDENEVRRENESLRSAIQSVPEFFVLQHIRINSPLAYDDLSKIVGIKKGKLRKFVKALAERGYVSIDKKSRPHRVVYISAPWRSSIFSDDTPVTTKSS